MFLSKIWFVLVGLVAAVAVSAAFIAPRSADRRVTELEGQRLDRAQYAAEQMLKNDAYRWINHATKLSRDAILAESLDNASRGAGEPRLLSDTVAGRIKALVPDLDGPGIDFIGAVDLKGRVVARVGESDGKAGDAIGGMEVVGDALRGFLSDDVWGAGGKLQRVAAVPVLSKTRDRIVGALVLGAETGKRLADLWKKNLGVEIALLLRGQPVAATVPEAFLSALPTEIESRANEIETAKRTRPIPLQVGGDRYFAVVAPFAGAAGAQGAFYALIGKMAPAADPLALLSTTTKDDLKWGNFPWVGLGVGVLLMIGVGLVLQRIEMEKPLTALRAEIGKLAKGEIEKLRDTAYAGKFGGIARDVNAAIDRYQHAPAAKSDTAKKDLGAILGPPPGEASVFDLPQSHFGGGLAPSNPFAPPPARTPPPVTLPPPVSSELPAFSGGFPGGFPGGAPLPPAPAPSGGKAFDTPRPVVTANALGATPQARLTSPPLGGGAKPVAAPPPPPLAALGGGSPGAPPPRPPGAQPAAASALPSGPQSLFGAPAPKAPTSAAAAPLPEFGSGDRTPILGLGERDAGEPGGAGGLGTFGGPGAPAEPTASGFADIASAASLVPSDGAGGFGAELDGDSANTAPQSIGGDAEETHVREVFEDYVATRQRCGESVASLTLEKFRDKLAANRQQLVSKYNCRTARFSVYVKDGKAAIKATPVR
jgi:hypothetical protein